MKVGLPDVIIRGRRRSLRNALAVATARTVCAGAAGFVLLLLLGTEALNWRWLAPLPLLTFVAGVVQVWRCRPTAYGTAQLLDARLHLADTLSTAIFYWPPHSWVKCHAGMRCSQRDYAMRVAAGVDLRAALPLRLPRPVLSCLTALAVLAVGLVVLRYRLEGHLDLRGSALPGVQQWVRNLHPELTGLERHLRAVEHDERADAPRGDDAPPEEKSGPDSSDARPSADGDSASESKGLAEKSKTPASGAGKHTAEKQTDGAGQKAADDAANTRDGGAQSGDAQSSERGAGQPGTSSGLLGKLSNSLANLASAIKSSFVRAAETKTGEGTASENSPSSAKTRGTGEPASRGNSNAGTSGAADSADTSASDAGPEGANGRSSNPDPRGGSGAGSDDGNKQIQLAKQLEAMGKISVILGKRSQTVSGSATVEVTSGRSGLMTPYVARQAIHAAAESADRDRIPIEFETYVQQYFRELRRRTGRGSKNEPERP